MEVENFRSRKEQIEKDFARELRRVLKQEGIGYFNRAQNAAIRKALRDAAMVGATEERYRTLKIVNDHDLRKKIVEQSVLTVLGYE